MKYARLTKEQLDSLQQEFIHFLATQSITGDEWRTIKEKQPEVAEQELDVFSDLVWEGALGQAKFLENVAPKLLFLFKLGTDQMSLISVKVLQEGIDISTQEGYTWLQKNYASDDVEFYTATKAYTEDKNLDVFTLIQQGAIITKGTLYEFFEGILNS
jgi:cag pathogenicity island protein 24